MYQITLRKKNHLALGDWTRLAWAQVHYSNHYATGTLASGLWSVQNLENVWILKQISYSKSSFQTIHDWFFLSDNFTLKFCYKQIKMQISYTHCLYAVYSYNKKLLRISLISHIRHKSLLNVFHMALLHWFSWKRHLASEF